ncbi:hypothetical protein A0J52_07995 [Clostridium sporogenes]|nr:hypothetical protein A0J52_07995 [Clostridium sporogenes]STC80688.1 Uncharacterised protein [Clostridium botulinum]SUY61788.1 Uncharacterised protein [Clostridium sporogenes]
MYVCKNTICYSQGIGSNPILPKEVIENISVLLSGQIGVLETLIAAVLSANVANVLIYFKTKNEVVWIMINLIPIFVALVVVGSWCNGSTLK